MNVLRVKNNWLISVILAAVAVAASLSGCDSDGRVVHLYVSYSVDTAVRLALLDVADLLAVRSRGRIQLDVATEELPREETPVTPRDAYSINLRNLESISQSYLPLSAFEAPYMFRDLNHFSETMDSPLGQNLLAEGMRHSRERVLGVWSLGVREVTLKNTPATTPAAFSQIKLRVPAGIMFVEGARALGCQPTTMSLDDVYTALRTGIIDGQENALPTIKLKELHTICRYLILTHHKVGTVVPSMPDSVWQLIPPRHQRVILEAFREGRERNIQYIQQEENRLIQEFTAAGMTVVSPDLTPFRRRARHIWKRYSGVWGDSIAIQVQRIGVDTALSARTRPTP